MQRFREDFNLLNVDPAYVKNTAFGGTIAYGFLTLTYISEMMGSFFGMGWL